MTPEDSFQDSPVGFSSTRDDLALSYGDLAGSPEAGRECNRPRSSLHTKTPCMETNSYGDFVAFQNTPLLRTLMEAEAAANSAAVQLMSFKETMEDEYAGSRQCATDKRRVSRQRGLLLEKLEVFKRINMSVRQQLKELQDVETGRIKMDKQIGILLQKFTQAESENMHLKKDLSDREKRVEELTALRRKELEHTENVVQTAKAVEATRAHLQGQLRNKEADNNRLTVQLRAWERTLTERKMEIDELREVISSLSEKASLEKEALKKATRAQKQRAERFETAVDKCYTQLREKDIQLAGAYADRDSWRRQLEQKAEERGELEAQFGLLKSQVADLTAQLQREKEESSAANEGVLQRVENLNAGNGELNFENATLKASITELEQQLAVSEATLIEERAASEERRGQAEQYQRQVAELQLEVDDMRIKSESLSRDVDNDRDRKDAEVAQVREELEGRLMELEGYPELLSVAQQCLLEVQDKLSRSERKCADQSESIRQLQVKVCSRSKLTESWMGSRVEKLQSSREMKESIQEANLKLQDQVDSLQRKMEKLQQENQDLVRSLAGQEEALTYSNMQLDQRSSECHTLNRHLEAALADVKQQVIKVKEKTVSRESGLQTRILELEAERSRKENELKQLKQSKLTAERQFDVRLRDLQLSLEQSESHKQSIQNYVEFLKSSYSTMFEEGLPTSGFGSTYFFR
ncbi:outer dense fiber protein 2-like [Aplochiton taeniatus]